MKRHRLFASAFAAAVGLAAAVGAVATADPAKDAKPSAPAAGTAAGAPAGQPEAKLPEMKLPPGWTMDDVQACMAAGTPGKMHEHLAKGVGVWTGKNTMWMSPGGEGVTTDCTSTVTAMLDGRYVKVEMAGEMPGMGPYNGFGIYGFDNVAGRFVSTWIDNHSTGIMAGTGELTPDGKVTTTKYAYTCPLTKKLTVMREVETITGPNTKTMEMHGVDPKSGKEYKMMSIALTRK